MVSTAAPLIAVTSAPTAATGTQREFLDLYLREFAHLSGYCAGLVNDDELGEEIAQEAFTRLFARWLRVRDPAAYVFRIATNLVKDQWRRQATERQALQSIATLTVASAPARDRSLRDLVERLPRHLRDVVLLHYYGDLSVEQVAHAVRRPVGTVKRQLHSARHRLLAGLEEQP